MNDAARKEVYRGYTIRYYQDQDPMNPRDNDNLGTMVCFHQRYDLGDVHNMSQEDLRDLVKRADVVYLPLYLLDHSGITMRAGRDFRDCDPGAWDSGCVGAIYMDYATIRREMGRQGKGGTVRDIKHITKRDRERALNCLRAEVAEYDAYLTGDVYGYMITAPDGRDFGGCWGFSQWHEYAHKAMREGAEEEIDQDITSVFCQEIDTRSAALAMAL